MFNRIKPSLILKNSMKFHSGKPKLSSPFLETDGSKQVYKYYHLSGVILVGLTPIAFIISPSIYNFPIDLSLGFIFPFHSHVAINAVISDYVPKPIQTPSRVALLITTVATAIGLLKLNIQGPGITETLKSLWRKPTK
mmetsp:Transcript_4719/g.4224  ORF Transcript_4719/g.4224 Transcript_4719/m.4224 type:complete len:138 (-) Transcript_4719:72-485(-)